MRFSVAKALPECTTACSTGVKSPKSCACWICWAQLVSAWEWLLTELAQAGHLFGVFGQQGIRAARGHRRGCLQFPDGGAANPLEVGLYTVQLSAVSTAVPWRVASALALLLQGGSSGSEGGTCLAHHAQQGVHCPSPLRLVLRWKDRR